MAKEIISTEPRRLYRPKQVAAMLGVNLSTIWRLEKRGDLPCRFTITRNVTAFDAGEIEAWLTQRKSSRYSQNPAAATPEIQKRGRGRPRKQPV